MGTRIKQADGTYCYSGVNCKRHGSYNRNITLPAQKTDAVAEVERTSDPEKFPEWYTRNEEYHLQYRDNVQQLLEETGLKKQLQIPLWNRTATDYSLLELPVDKNTSLLISSDNNGLTARRSYTVWMTKHQKPVVMLRLLVSPKEDQEYWGENVLCDIETRPEERGKGYAMEAIRYTEQNMLDTPIHSGGHYTPEGEQALRGKLPYTKSVLYEEARRKETEEKFGKSFSFGPPPIGVHFRSMDFVEDWEQFQKKV